jgi:hypothetical protein
MGVARLGEDVVGHTLCALLHFIDRGAQALDSSDPVGALILIVPQHFHRSYPKHRHLAVSYGTSRSSPSGHNQGHKTVVTKNTIDERRREALLWARHAADLRQIARGIAKRADDLQRRSDALMRDWERRATPK